jgi:hypothetical protein
MLVLVDCRLFEVNVLALLLYLIQHIGVEMVCLVSMIICMSNMRETTVWVCQFVNDLVHILKVKLRAK